VCFMIGEKGADLIKADAMSNDGTQYRRA
jgi:hypothetical protein